MFLLGIGNIYMLLSYERWEDKLLERRNEYGPIYTYWMDEQDSNCQR